MFNILVIIYYIIFYSKENFINFSRETFSCCTLSLHFFVTPLEIIQCFVWKDQENRNHFQNWTCFLLIYLGKGYVILFLLLLNVQSSPYSIIMVVSFINFQTFSYIYSKMHFCPYIYQIYVLKPKNCFNFNKFCAGCRFLWSVDSNLILLWCLLCNNFDIQLCSVK